MAITLKTLRWGDLAVGISIFVLAALTGCANPKQPRTTIPPIAANTTPIPAPSFDGPNILPRSAAGAPKAQANAGTVSGPAAWRPRVAPRDWKWIVIHHSATPTGSMAFFDKEHKAKGWDGVGYHFVIGNGTDTGDGQIEVTQRWPLQKWGAHAKTVDNRFNEHGIGICLVGNFDVERPSAKQIQNLSRLVGHLMQTYRIPAQNVVGHRDTKPTDCPGRYVNLASIRSSAAAIAVGSDAHADATGDGDDDNRDGDGDDEVAPSAQIAAGAELLSELPR
jgi:hypothetical protein